MNLIVTANATHVCFETRVCYSPAERRLFLDSLAPWVARRVTCSSGLIFADLPLRVVNDHLPYGHSPVRFLWDLLIDAHFNVVSPPSAY